MKEELEKQVNNLFEGKIIYNESFTILCEFVKIDLKEDKFFIELKPIRLLIDIKKQHNNFLNWVKSKPTFRVGSVYQLDNRKYFNGKKVGGPYCPYTLWTDPIFVEKVSKMSEEELEEDIWGLLWD